MCHVSKGRAGDTGVPGQGGEAGSPGTPGRIGLPGFPGSRGLPVCFQHSCFINVSLHDNRCCVSVQFNSVIKAIAVNRETLPVDWPEKKVSQV